VNCPNFLKMKINQSIVVGIDASRNRSGGAKAHLIGILSELNPYRYGISFVHIWSFQSLLDQLPDRAWLVKHNCNPNNLSLPLQLWWQAFVLSNELAKNRCDILFTTDASTLCRFKPMVVLSQDLLSYEPGIIRSFGNSWSQLRLIAILFLQNRAFRTSDGVIFLTKYAQDLIQKSCNHLNSFVCIPHGVDNSFKEANLLTNWPSDDSRAIRCVYVSNTDMYKYQWSVVDAIAILRQRGHNLNLKLIGGGSGRAQMLLDETIKRVDPEGRFVEKIKFIPKDDLLEQLIISDLFIFASGCESFGITLVEGMSIGLPIACSNRSSLPETLNDGGVYFDPSNPKSVADSVEAIIKSKELRKFISDRAKFLSKQYSWKRCADETWNFVVNTYHRKKS
jgi:glycosyltransferase involved in cell wall biosynthesis